MSVLCLCHYYYLVEKLRNNYTDDFLPQLPISSISLIGSFSKKFLPFSPWTKFPTALTEVKGII